MKIRWIRILIAALVVEALAIGLLVAAVAFFGPIDAAQAKAFAANTGRWLGPSAGAVLTFLAALWVCSKLAARHVLNGVLLGVLVAVLDVLLLIAAGEPFQWLFVASNIGKIAAGALGGFVSSKRSSKAAQLSGSVRGRSGS